MRILHLMLSNFYIDNGGYQENIIPKINKEDGHEVLIIASTEVFIDNDTLGYINPMEYINSSGINVVRLPYKKIINKFISRKVRAYSNLYSYIERFKPNIILFHGAAAWALNTIAKYKKNNPHVKFFVDSHEDKNNSARSWISRFLLYDCFYSPIIRRNIKYIDKILYITKETLNFIIDVYKIPESKLYFFPLGGIILDENERIKYRNDIREQLGLQPEDILCVHSGKLDKLKRTIEIIKGFTNFENPNFFLILIGIIQDNLEDELNMYLSKDSRIKFLGWKSANDLQKYLMAGDLYIQLGSQSVTMQHALCNGCSVAVYPHESHLFLLEDKVYYIENENDITDLLISISHNREDFEYKREQGFNFAKDNLDYNDISNIILKDI